MKKSYKILLGIATIWPVLYMLLFLIGIFSFIIFTSFEENRSNRVTEYLDLIQLEQKIQKHELKSLTITGSEIVAEDRIGEKRYRANVTNKTTKAEIIRQAQERDIPASRA
jgi:cbb3-type cytochrome oxidase subunit 3